MKHIDQEYCLPFDKENPEFWMRIEHLGRYIFAADYIRRTGAKVVLDAACANGYGCIEMASSGAFIYGIDYNASLIGSAQKAASSAQIDNVRFRCADLNTDPPGSFSPDLITCFDTLEHLKSPSDFLRRLHSSLKKNGALLLSVPKAKYEPVDSGGNPTNEFHLHRFEKQDLLGMIESAGFSIQKVLYQPYTNICMSLENNARRDTGVKKQDVRAYFDPSDEALRFFARMFALPTSDLEQFSYSVFITAQKV